MSESALLFHISDVHFGLEDRAALDWVMREVEERKPEGIVLTGDLTMRARSREFAAAADWLESLNVPVVIEPGNHDLPGYHLPERYLNPLGRFEEFRAQFGSQLDIPGLALIGLNTNVPAQPRFDWSKGWVSRTALERCLEQIDHLPAGTRTLVLAHHPLREAGTDGTAFTHGGGEALAQLARRNVLAVLSGHVHDPFDIMEATDVGPIRMIGAGTLSTRLRSTPASFNELTWDGERLSVRVCRLEGEVGSDPTYTQAAPL